MKTLDFCLYVLRPVKRPLTLLHLADPPHSAFVIKGQRLELKNSANAEVAKTATPQVAKKGDKNLTALKIILGAELSITHPWI